MAEPTGMANHGNRPEIRQALLEGYGEDVRRSDTFGEKTMYSAVRIKDGTVVRVSQARFTMFALFTEVMGEILVILFLAGALALGLAAGISKRIVEQDETITRLKVDVDEKTKEADFRKEFTANVSHELKTPLTSISGFAEIIKNGFVKEEDIPRFAGRIYDEAQRLIILVEDIIKLSQLDEKQFSARKETLDLYLLCEDTLYMLETIAEKSGITMELAGDHIEIEGVGQILSEIVYNLCDNAIKYNRPEGRVSVSVFEEGGRPAVCVADTGIGIPSEDLDRVFERFYRVNKSHSKEIGGTGLGLSIVKHGAAYHNAQIHVDSKLGEGTKITVIF
jgi:two-component system phosphate regulon sensor histidine kinase PhoR